MALFVQAMLSKVDSAIYKKYYGALNLWGNFLNNNQVITSWEYIWKNWFYFSEIKALTDKNTNSIELYNNTTQQVLATRDITTNGDIDIDLWIFDFWNTTNVIQRRFKSSYTGTDNNYKDLVVLKWGWYTAKDLNAMKIYPREIKEIWKKATATLFGLHIDNSRITQDA